MDRFSAEAYLRNKTMKMIGNLKPYQLAMI